LIFILGLIAAAYSSADSALTSLTTSFCVDILEIDIKDSSSIIRRKYIHLLFSVIILVVILTLNAINDQSIISSIFSVAGYTYGPLLGLYFFGLFTSYSVNDKLVPYIAIIAPVLSYIIQTYYSIGFEILIVNALIVCLGLFVTKENKLLSAR
ncbi:sodium:solute symporter, partial [bacterium]|nr:sodium:solute symporter [bacterium]